MKPLTPEYEFLRDWNNKAKEAGETSWRISTEFVDALLANTAEDEEYCPCGMPVRLCGGPEQEDENE